MKKRVFVGLAVALVVLMVTVLTAWAYVDDVISVFGTFGAPVALSSDPAVAEPLVIGPPNQSFIQISDDSYIEMHLDSPITVDSSLATSDLVIDTYDQPYPAAAKIDASQDGSTWVEVVGPALNECDETRMYVFDDLDQAYVDLTQTGLSEVSYVRLTDYPGSIDGEFVYPSLGFDLDAIYEGHQRFQDCQPVTIVEVDIDIKPGSCPNPLNTKSKGVLPVAVLGTADFDVTTIDPATIRLTRDGDDGVSPLRWSYEDVATPSEGELCECHDLNGDGYLDLTLKFSRQEVTDTLDLGGELGSTIPLLLTGNLKEEFDGTPIEGSDCVWVLSTSEE